MLQQLVSSGTFRMVSAHRADLARSCRKTTRDTVYRKRVGVGAPSSHLTSQRHSLRSGTNFFQYISVFNFFYQQQEEISTVHTYIIFQVGTVTFLWFKKHGMLQLRIMPIVGAKILSIKLRLFAFVMKPEHFVSYYPEKMKGFRILNFQFQFLSKG